MCEDLQETSLQSYYFLALKRLLVSFVLMPLTTDPNSARAEANFHFLNFKACCELVCFLNDYWSLYPVLNGYFLDYLVKHLCFFTFVVFVK